MVKETVTSNTAAAVLKIAVIEYTTSLIAGMLAKGHSATAISPLTYGGHK